MKTTLAIGDYVRAFTLVKSKYVSGHKKLSLEMPQNHNGYIDGWIVGATRRFEGEVVNGIYDYDGYGDPPHLEVETSMFVYKIATSLMNKPVEARGADIYLIEPVPRVRPQHLRKGTPWPTKNGSKELQSETMKNWPRDSKGRWLKEQ